MAQLITSASGTTSKTKVGAWLISAAATLQAVAQVPGLPTVATPWLHVASLVLGGIGAVMGGIGIRDAIDKK